MPSRLKKPARSQGSGAIEDLSPEKLEAKARKIILDQLSRAAKSRRQLETLLLERDIPSEIFGPLLDRFEELQLIDDAALAKYLVQSRQSSRGLSRRAISNLLKERGISEDHALAALSLIDDESELARATELATKKYQSLERFEPSVRMRRTTAFLMRRGYSGSTVGEALRIAIRG